MFQIFIFLKDWNPHSYHCHLHRTFNCFSSSMIKEACESCSSEAENFVVGERCGLKCMVHGHEYVALWLCLRIWGENRLVSDDTTESLSFYNHLQIGRINFRNGGRSENQKRVWSQLQFLNLPTHLTVGLSTPEQNMDLHMPIASLM